MKNIISYIIIITLLIFGLIYAWSIPKHMYQTIEDIPSEINIIGD